MCLGLVGVAWGEEGGEREKVPGIPGPLGF